MAELSSAGVSVVDSAENDEVEESEEEVKSGNLSDEARGSDDPVRMYLREMGTVELLTREGEIAIAKRIEAGRELLLGGICESPLTLRALMDWRDKIVSGEVLLRDLIDLDTTFGRSGAAAETDENGLPTNLVESPVIPGQAIPGQIPLKIRMMMPRMTKLMTTPKRAKRPKPAKPARPRQRIPATPMSWACRFPPWKNQCVRASLHKSTVLAKPSRS